MGVYFVQSIFIANFEYKIHGDENVLPVVDAVDKIIRIIKPEFIFKRKWSDLFDHVSKSRWRRDYRRFLT